MPNAYADYKLTPQRCEPDAQDRCSYHGPRGQCIFRAIPDNMNCPLHAGQTDIKTVNEDLYNYTRGQVAARLNKMRTNQRSHTLVEELAILRFTLEQAINSFTENPYDLITNQSTITSLVSSIRDTIDRNQRLEQKYGDLLNLEQVSSLITNLFSIVSDYVKDPDDLEAIAERVMHMLENHRDYANKAI